VVQKRLDLDDKLGNFNVGKEADFVVLNLKATALQQLRQSRAKSLEDSLFALFTMGDDRNIEATYIYGQKAYSKTKAFKQTKVWIIIGYGCAVLLNETVSLKMIHFLQHQKMHEISFCFKISY
jgi:hypothetical protein